MKKFLSILCAILSVVCLSFAFAGCGKEETPLSDADRDILRYSREATIDDNFDDDKVVVILKSAFDYLEELHFDDFKIVEKVAPIDYFDLYTEQYPYIKGETFPLKKHQQNHMFRIIFKDCNKEKVLRICKLLNTLDIVLSSEPKFIMDVEFTGTTSDSEYGSQWALNGSNGINSEQAWDITLGNL